MALGAPEAEFVGVDLAERPIALARDAARRCGCANVRFDARDLVEVDASYGRFDYHRRPWRLFLGSRAGARGADARRRRAPFRRRAGARSATMRCPVRAAARRSATCSSVVTQGRRRPGREIEPRAFVFGRTGRGLVGHRSRRIHDEERSAPHPRSRAGGPVPRRTRRRLRAAAPQRRRRRRRAMRAQRISATRSPT